MKGMKRAIIISLAVTAAGCFISAAGLEALGLVVFGLGFIVFFITLIAWMRRRW